MSDLASLLCAAIARRSRAKKVALLLSGGLDSLTVGLALERCGKTVHAYTYHLEGYPSRDLDKARGIAKQLRWTLEIVSVPTSSLADDFIRLVVEQRCYRKAQFEVTFPLLYIFPLIGEREIWTGWNADPHYGNTKNAVLGQRRMRSQGWSSAKRKKAFDDDRRSYFFDDLRNPASPETWWWGKRLASQFGKALLDPYVDDSVINYFLQFSHEQLSPLTKPIVRRAFAADLARLQKGSLTVGVQMQTGGSVDRLFATLLSDESINRFKMGDGDAYTTVSALCQRWGREARADPKRFTSELKRLPAPHCRDQEDVRTSGL